MDKINQLNLPRENHMQAPCKPSDSTCTQLRAASERLRFAKDRWTSVAVEVLHGRADAAQAQAVLDELTAAQRAMRDLLATQA
jgi:hypothetical protein